MSVIFKNQGLIDPRCITTMGVNVKPDAKSPIGYFGTGLKYAIAVLLREGQSITIWRGVEPLKFTMSQVEIRGKEFGLVCINDVELGFTTELGKNWQVWQAYRELSCNASDEGGTTAAAHDDCAVEFSGREGETWIVCSGDKIDKAYADRREFLLTDAPDVVLKGLEIRNRPSRSIFYRGIAVSQVQKQSALTYNLLDGVKLTEDRTALEAWWLPYLIGHAIQASTDKALLTRVVIAPAGSFERSLIYSKTEDTSEEFLEVVADQLSRNITGVNASACDVFKSKRGILAEKIDEFAPNKIEAAQLSAAIAFAIEIGFPVNDYRIVLATRIGSGVLGLAHGGTIYVTKKAFEGGTKQVAATLIEEFIHLREGFTDETRALQDYLLLALVSLGERFVGRPL